MSARTYGVELLCSAAPEIYRPLLTASMQRFCPGVEPLGREADATLAFQHPGHKAHLHDGTVSAAQTFVSVTEEPGGFDRLMSAVRQSWSFAGAEEAVQSCGASVLVTDIMASTLDRRARLDLFHSALRAVLGVVDCVAIAWLPSERIVDPATWVAAYEQGGAQRFLAGSVNVRLFHGEGSSVMDTRGLHELGLPDLQCHFRGLDPDAVARQLYNIAWYIYSEGDVIADGHTVEGSTPGSRWWCRHQEALVAPARVVLDVDPGPPHRGR